MSLKQNSRTDEQGRSRHSAPPAKHPAGATRRRGAALKNALLDAAWEELQQSGYAKVPSSDGLVEIVDEIFLPLVARHP